MEDGQEEGIDCNNPVKNQQSTTLSTKMTSGDASMVSYIEYPTNKPLDYIDDSVYIQNEEESQTPSPRPRGESPNQETTDHQPSPILINTTNLMAANNGVNNNNFLNSPLKPPRHVKLKNRTRHLSCDLNFSNNNNYNHYLDKLTTNQQLHQDLQLNNDYHIGNIISHPNGVLNNRNKLVSVGVQASPLPPYRLRVLPKCPQGPIAKKTDDLSPSQEDIIISESSPGCCICTGARSCGQCMGRVLLSQCGLSVALFAWALLGAAAFYYTEGPFELQQIGRLKTVQNDLVIGLATDLRKVDVLQPVWKETIEKYVAKHETLLLAAVSAGYGEGGDKHGQIWSYPGCILFAISLLTTLGFGAPVPRTALGRTTAVVFSAIGIPLHFLLVLNLGMVLARRLQRWSTNYLPYSLDATLNEKKSKTFDFTASLPKWLHWFPIVTGIPYYIFGVLVFGVARQRSFESFLFPLDFTATGGVAQTPGYTRISYGLYLEGAVMIGGIAVSLLQNSATGKMTEIGLKLGLLTNS